MTAPLSPLLVEDAVRMALAEDLGRAGDITSAATIPAEATARATLGARKAGTVAGLELVIAAFRALDPSIAVSLAVADGDRVQPGAVVAEIAGPGRPVLAAERVALNYLGHLSGVATATAELAAAIGHTHARVTCTRKTTPGLRALEKYAVRCGGGSNHRFGLDDAILIKDNHIAVAGGVARAVHAARAAAGHTVRVEVEVTNLDELAEAMSARPDIVMLDNMNIDDMRLAVAEVGRRAIVEASGNITIDTIAAVAETGVDYISSGWITHSAPSLDVGLDVVVEA